MPTWSSRPWPGAFPRRSAGRSGWRPPWPPVKPWPRQQLTRASSRGLRPCAGTAPLWWARSATPALLTPIWKIVPWNTICFMNVWVSICGAAGSGRVFSVFGRVQGGGKSPGLRGGRCSLFRLRGLVPGHQPLERTRTLSPKPCTWGNPRGSGTFWRRATVFSRTCSSAGDAGWEDFQAPEQSPVAYLNELDFLDPAPWRCTASGWMTRIAACWPKAKPGWSSCPRANRYTGAGVPAGGPAAASRGQPGPGHRLPGGQLGPEPVRRDGLAAPQFPPTPGICGCAWGPSTGPGPWDVATGTWAAWSRVKRRPSGFIPLAEAPR